MYVCMYICIYIFIYLLFFHHPIPPQGWLTDTGTVR